MKRIAVRMLGWVAIVAVGLAMPCVAADDDHQLPQATELIKALRLHYVDREKIDDKMLNDASVSGILKALGQGAVILTPVDGESKDELEKAPTPSNGALARVEIIEPDIGYIRLADVVGETLDALDKELKKFSQANVLGFVLDLRFADGSNYKAAAELASRFLNDGQELFTVKSAESGTQAYRSSAEQRPVLTEGADLTTAPLMVLINSETRGSAEALAGALRSQDRCILIGGKTAGSAVAWQDVKLGDGRVLRLATSKVVLPSGGLKTDFETDVFPSGITPDVPVRVDTNADREAVFELKSDTTLTASLQPRQKKKGISEAELVRVFRGEALDTKTSDGEGEQEGEIQQVRDVTLQRAVDILKGIRVLLSQL